MHTLKKPQTTFRRLRYLKVSWCRPIVNAVLLASLMPIAAITNASAEEARLSVPVRILNAPQPAPQMNPLMAANEPAPAATPAARMPQYQLHHKDVGDPGDPNSPQLRFVLAMPEQPLLIEASILIDGQPFRQARERRVQEIMNYIADPEAFKTEARSAAEAARSEVEAQAEVLAAETPVAESAAAEVPAVPVVPAVPKYAAPATIYERIDRYTQSVGAPPSVDEVRWLLTNWVDGPLLLFLNDNFQRFRADQQPVYKVLDRDRDGNVSVEELSQSVASFRECDLNRDDIVEATELAQAAKDVRDQPTNNSTGKLVFRIPDEASATPFLRRLAARYAGPEATTPTLPRFDVDGNGVLSPEELQQLHERPADIRLRIELSTSQPETSRLFIEGFGDEFAALKDSAKLNPASLTLSFPGFNLEFLAVQGSNSDQISIGAVNDGYAMLQEIDPNTDGRFSIRELRQLNERLAAFDRNSDGQITSDETHPTFRVCIGLGPIAHQPLALLRGVNAAASETLVAGPEWFTEMDKNKDYDLTRQEFPGTDEQFKQLDADSDELISAVEANK